MNRYLWVAVVTCLAAACAASTGQSADALLALDREWAEAARAKEIEKFISYYAPEASVYAPGMPVATGTAAIRGALEPMFKAPGFALQFAPTKGSVSGDFGYTAGTYQMMMSDAGGSPVSETGKYVTVWKKQASGEWKVTDDIFNADAAPRPPASAHTIAKGNALTWGDPPPALPAGATMAVVSGDPAKAAPFTVRLRMPAGYRVLAHRHPTDEHVTVLAGTIGLGIGEKFDQAALKDLGPGDYALLPAEAGHFGQAKTAAIIQLHGVGPFVLGYVNPADDPSRR